MASSCCGGNETAVEIDHSYKFLQAFDSCRLWEVCDCLHLLFERHDSWAVRCDGLGSPNFSVQTGTLRFWSRTKAFQGREKRKARHVYQLIDSSQPTWIHLPVAQSNSQAAKHPKRHLRGNIHLLRLYHKDKMLIMQFYGFYNVMYFNCNRQLNQQGRENTSK